MRLLLLDINPVEMCSDIYPDTCSVMFKAALFLKAPNWKQSKCPSYAAEIKGQETFPSEAR